MPVILITLSPVEQLQVVLFFACFLMLAGWIYQSRHSEASVVDAIWALGIGSACVFYAAVASGQPERRALVAVTGGFWGWRLGSYLLKFRVIGKPEDARYSKLRSIWGTAANRNFFFFFQFQAVLILLFSLPAWVVCNDSARGIQVWDWVGAVVAIGAIGGETLADKQLSRFRGRAGSRGKTCREGLWRYSRHPNYFFEWLHWFSYVFYALGASLWWVTLLGPVLMFWFLYKITGIPWTEEQDTR
jgi:steroid 5-alpha reductase family enzyme